MRNVCMMVALVVSSLCFYSSTPLSAQTGIVDYVPNGSFEEIAKPDIDLINYAERFGKYSLFWRQFHRHLDANEDGTVPEWPITRDRIWLNDPLQMYEPVTCSSSDLFSEHLPNCVIGPPIPSHFDIPENRFGTEPIRPGSAGQKYAGLYYRLNGIVPNGVDSYGPATPGDVVAGWWREYLEVELLCELEANKTYNLSFWATLAEVSDRSIPIEARLTPLPYHTHPLDD